MIRYRNYSGQPVRIVATDGRRVTFVKLHINTLQPIGSHITLPVSTFELRYPS